MILYLCIIAYLAACGYLVYNMKRKSGLEKWLIENAPTPKIAEMIKLLSR